MGSGGSVGHRCSDLPGTHTDMQPASGGNRRRYGGGKILRWMILRNVLRMDGTVKVDFRDF